MHFIGDDARMRPCRGIRRPQTGIGEFFRQIFHDRQGFPHLHIVVDDQLERHRRSTAHAFFGSPGTVSGASTGPPSFFQAPKPPLIWATGLRPMRWAVCAASAERKPPAQKNTKRCLLYTSDAAD